MIAPGARALEERFLVVAPVGRDASLTTHLLARAGLTGVPCKSVEAACHAFDAEGAAAFMIAEEALRPAAMAELRDRLHRQSAWSDIPILIFIGSPATLRPSDLLDALGNVTLLERPLRPITMVSAAQAALRARRRQYAARAELEAQRRAVQQRDQFLAMLGHELRNPLSAINMALALEEPRRDGASGANGAIMRRQVKHLTHLVDDLLDTARVTSGKVTLKREELDLVELVRTSVAMLRPNVEANGTALRFTALEPELRVNADPVRIEQVLTNLITNASKYTPPGGSIEVSLRVEGVEAILEVRDTGVGIAPEMLGRVFELFAQVDGTLDRAKGGMGIGLTLVRSLVELHGGSVHAHSDGLGRGSVFAVRLPRSEATSQPPAVRASQVPRAPSRAHEVLVIEDNDDSRELLTMLLERRGHHVYSAMDGITGVEAALEHKPTVLLADIGLPGLDGYAVAQRVRQQLGGAIFMIAITGYGQPQDRERALAAGFDLHLTKPVDPEALDAAFQELGC